VSVDLDVAGGGHFDFFELELQAHALVKLYVFDFITNG
jgi:hypothetical protein